MRHLLIRVRLWPLSLPGWVFWRSWIVWNLLYPRSRAYVLKGDVSALRDLVSEVSDSPTDRFSELAVVAFALGLIGGDPEVELLAPLLASDVRVEVRVCAADALERIGSAKAVEALRPALFDEPWAVQMSVLRALAVSATRSDGPSLAKVIAQQTDPRLPYQLVRGEAALGIGRTGDPEWIPTLKGLVATDGWIGVLAGVRALDKIGTPDARQALKDLRRTTKRTVVRCAFLWLRVDRLRRRVLAVARKWI